MTKPRPDGGRPDGEPGTLYVVATPIGHLGDLTSRAAAVLRAVAVVAAEDTRETAKLLRHVESHARLMSVHAHSPTRRLDDVIAALAGGADVAITSDAGTPGVSDPGPALVARAREAGIRVVPIPGPSAVHAALSVAGFPADRYCFAGFAPRRGADRARWLAEVDASVVPVVCFEAPGRLASLLHDLSRVCGAERPALVGRELTKLHEEIVRAPLGDLADRFAVRDVRGEVTIVVQGAPVAAAPEESDLGARLATALRGAGVEGRRAAGIIEEVAGLSRNASYRLALGEDA